MPHFFTTLFAPDKFNTAVRYLAAATLTVLSCACGGGGGGGGSGVPDPAPVVPIKVEQVISKLSYPVSLEFAPDGRLFFSEVYSGRVRVAVGGTVNTAPFIKLDGPKGDEVVLGLALDPAFASNHFVYVFNTADNPVRSRVIRYREGDGRGSDPLVLIDGLPQGFHDGGILRFGSDGTLFISIGDSNQPALAQDPAQLAGKILRINPDGSIPSDNPFDASPVFATGFRNVFGMALNPESGKLFAADNGPDCNDEIDLVQSGGNYGWREGQPCDDQDDSFISPVITIDPTVGITDAVFYQGAMFPEYSGNLLVADFNGGAVRRFAVDGETGEVGEGVVMLEGGYGGILSLANGPDGAIYFSTADAIYKISRG